MEPYQALSRRPRCPRLIPLLPIRPALAAEAGAIVPVSICSFLDVGPVDDDATRALVAYVEQRRAEFIDRPGPGSEPAFNRGMRTALITLRDALRDD